MSGAFFLSPRQPAQILRLVWILLTLVCSILAVSSHARETALPADWPTVAATSLPAEAREVLKLIHKGGPFPYAKDNTTFNNRELRLPREPRGWYREYTVSTPGVRNRGARRIVCGGKPAKVCWYSDDHYVSFRRITE